MPSHNNNNSHGLFSAFHTLFCVARPPAEHTDPTKMAGRRRSSCCHIIITASAEDAAERACLIANRPRRKTWTPALEAYEATQAQAPPPRVTWDDVKMWFRLARQLVEENVRHPGTPQRKRAAFAHNHYLRLWGQCAVTAHPPPVGFVAQKQAPTRAPLLSPPARLPATDADRA
jgi:hypothetical protein